MSISDQIIGAESGGDPNAQNPNSSASGPGQFINSTFLDVARKMRPELADKSDAEVLALKTDPDISKQATDYYAQQNQAILAKNGLPVTPGSTYLAHFAGPGGAVKVLQADPDAPVESILGAAAVKANPFLQGMTAQGLQAWAAKKMGTPAPVAGPQPSPQAAQQPAPQPQPQAPQATPQGPQPQQPSAPIFAQQPAQTAPQAVFAAPRRPIDLSGLKAALAARGAPVFASR